MRILVYPHDLNMGGSQTNAIELAAAVRDLGHECIIYGRPGVLNDRIAALGLEFIESPRPSHRPTPWIVRALRETVRSRGVDVVHGYEWPPGLEALLATTGSDTKAICTVMSMAVAPFLPDALPLVVGTREIAAHERSRGRLSVQLMEPPVDLSHNQRPQPSELTAFRAQWGLGGLPLLVCVSRLANELKSEGLLTAIEVAGELAASTPFQLLLVGDGPARPRIAAAAERINRQTGANTVVMTGELSDPRPAYAVADIALAMGGSALRSLAFGIPLVVQGEEGFFTTLTPESAEMFRWQGWYGVGSGSAGGHATLSAELAPLLRDVDLRIRLGRFSREVAQDFSLTSAAHRQLALYQQVSEQAGDSSPFSRWADRARSTARFASYLAAEQWGRVTRTQRRDDFNAHPVAAPLLLERSANIRHPSIEDPILYVSGAEWGAVQGTDRNLAAALSRQRPVIWVDPPHPIKQVRRHRHVDAPVSSSGDGITRLCVDTLPGVSRPGLRTLANRRLAQHVRRYLRDSGIRPAAIIASTPEPMLAELDDVPGRRIYFATDDFVAAASLWSRDAYYLNRSRERNLAAADLVLAVTQELAEDLRRGPSQSVWFPNGADLERFQSVETAAPEPGVTLSQPTAGVVGQFNDRTDLDLLFAVHDAGIPMLLVGPAVYSAEQAERFADLTRRQNVQWVGRVERDRLPGFYRTITVGLTAYADSFFNRRSFPLKTVEYLAAGLPVVSTDVVELSGLDSPFVLTAHTPKEFVAAVRQFLKDPPPADEVRKTVDGHSWDDRATELLRLSGCVSEIETLTPKEKS